MKYKAIIFDMDGVLIDSEPVYLNDVIEYILEDLKYNIDIMELHHALCRIVGCSDQETYHIIEEILNHKYEAKDIRAGIYARPFELDYRTILNPHILNILPKLKEQGYRMVVASSSSYENICRVLKECGIQDYFEFVLSGFDFEKSKPHPEIYLTALSKLGLKNTEVIAIEDSTYGIQAARNAKVRVIAKKDDRFNFDQEIADGLATDLLDAYYLIQSWNS